MKADPRDMARLWDMIDCAKAIMQFIEGRCFEDFVSDRMLRNAIERNLEIIGEAARNVSAETRNRLTDIPWTSVVGLRNIIAHEYGEIRYERLWSICENRLPQLIQSLQSVEVTKDLSSDEN
ncbi:MAG TPA: DUF86 domain-containing protein [bacterium]|nr:DUF86 domain-containing protein [bacterium]